MVSIRTVVCLALLMGVLLAAMPAACPEWPPGAAVKVALVRTEMVLAGGIACPTTERKERWVDRAGVGYGAVLAVAHIPGVPVLRGREAASLKKWRAWNGGRRRG